MAQILVRNLDPAAVDRLKARAKRHGRSLQSEVRMLLELMAGESLDDALGAAKRIRKGLGKKFSDSVDLIREDRDR